MFGLIQIKEVNLHTFKEPKETKSENTVLPSQEYQE